MNKAEELKQALADFKKKYSGITSADLQTFIYGWGAAQQYANKERREHALKFAYHLADENDKGGPLYTFEEEYDNWLKEQEEYPDGDIRGDATENLPKEQEEKK